MLIPKMLLGDAEYEVVVENGLLSSVFELDREPGERRGRSWWRHNVALGDLGEAMLRMSSNAVSLAIGLDTIFLISA